MKDYIKIVNTLGNTGEIRSVERRATYYVNAIRELIPSDDLTNDLLDGLNILYIFAAYQDKTIDGVASNADAYVALMYHTKYLKWLSKYGKREVDLFLNSMEAFLEYTKKEAHSTELFDYDINSYTAKIGYIINHLYLMDRVLSGKYKFELEFVKIYYLIVLHSDDIEDYYDDIDKGITTVFGKWMHDKLGGICTLKQESYDYWLLADEFLSSWLEEQLENYSSFNSTEIYRQIAGIYQNIKGKIER